MSQDCTIQVSRSNLQTGPLLKVLALFIFLKKHLAKRDPSWVFDLQRLASCHDIIIAKNDTRKVLYQNQKIALYCVYTKYQYTIYIHLQFLYNLHNQHQQRRNATWNMQTATTAKCNMQHVATTTTTTTTTREQRPSMAAHVCKFLLEMINCSWNWRPL